MKLKTEKYKGYPIQFVSKMIEGGNGNKQLVVGSYPSKIVNKSIGAEGTTKDVAHKKCQKMIDKEMKALGKE